MKLPLTRQQRKASREERRGREVFEECLVRLGSEIQATRAVAWLAGWEAAKGPIFEDCPNVALRAHNYAGRCLCKREKP